MRSFSKKFNQIYVPKLMKGNPGKKAYCTSNKKTEKGKRKTPIGLSRIIHTFGDNP